MVENLFTTFRHELVVTVLVSAFIGGAMWPVRKIKAAYKETQEALQGISKELSEQRSNHLTHIEVSNERQVEILKEVASTLKDMHLDQRTLLGRLDK